MKMQKRLTLLLLLILAVGLTVGCTAGPAETTPPTQITTDPPTEAMTEESTQPVTEPVTETPTDQLPELQVLFDWNGELIYNQAAGHIYTHAAEVDLNLIFYNGVNNPGSWGSIEESERDLLVNAGFITEMDIQIMPAALLEEKLTRFFGLGLADVQIPEEWAYSADTDTYYSNHNDAYFPTVTVTGYADLPDGNVLVHLTVDMVEDGEEWYQDAPMYMTLRPTEGGWQIVSNVFSK